MAGQIPLMQNFYYELESERIDYTGDINVDIDTICNNLRQRLHAEIEMARVDAAEISMEYDRINFGIGRFHGASISLDIHVYRPETSDEIAARLAKERKEAQKKEAALRKSFNKDLETIRALALKHNLPLAISAGGPVEANARDES